MLLVSFSLYFNFTPKTLQQNPVAAIVGAILVLAADLIGRTIFTPLEIPAGVFTSAIGAPYFIYLLYKSRNS